MTALPVRKPVFAGKSFDNLKGRNNDAERRRYSDTRRSSSFSNFPGSYASRSSISDTSQPINKRLSFCSTIDNGGTSEMDDMSVFISASRKRLPPVTGNDATCRNDTVSTTDPDVFHMEICDAITNSQPKNGKKFYKNNNSITNKILKSSSEDNKEQNSSSKIKTEDTCSKSINDENNSDRSNNFRNSDTKIDNSNTHNNKNNNNNNNNSHSTNDFDVDFRKGLNISDHTLNMICRNIMARSNSNNNNDLISGTDGSVSGNSRGHQTSHSRENSCDIYMQASSCPSSPSCRTHQKSKPKHFHQQHQYQQHDQYKHRQQQQQQHLHQRNHRIKQSHHVQPHQHNKHVKSHSRVSRKTREENWESTPPLSDSSDSFRKNPFPRHPQGKMFPLIEENTALMRRGVVASRRGQCSEGTFSSDASSTEEGITSSRRWKSDSRRRRSPDLSSERSSERRSHRGKASEIPRKSKSADVCSERRKFLPNLPYTDKQMVPERLPPLDLLSEPRMCSNVWRVRATSDVSSGTRISSGVSLDTSLSVNTPSNASRSSHNKSPKTDNKVKSRVTKYTNDIEKRRESCQPLKHRKAIPKRKTETDPLKSFETSKSGAPLSKSGNFLTSEGNWDKLKRKWGSFVTVKGITHNMRYTFRDNPSSHTSGDVIDNR